METLTSTYGSLLLFGLLGVAGKGFVWQEAARRYRGRFEFLSRYGLPLLLALVLLAFTASGLQAERWRFDPAGTACSLRTLLAEGPALRSYLILAVLVGLVAVLATSALQFKDRLTRTLLSTLIDYVLLLPVVTQAAQLWLGRC